MTIDTEFSDASAPYL